MKKILRHQYYHTKNLELNKELVLESKLHTSVKIAIFGPIFLVKGVSEYKGIKGNQSHH